MPIEQINDTTAKVRLLEDEVEIGDIQAPTFMPHAKLKRWGEECYLAIKPSGVIEEEVEIEAEAEKVKCKYKIKLDGLEWEFENEFYALPAKTLAYGQDEIGKDREFTQNEFGGFEFETIFQKKPPSNKLSFDIELKGLTLFPQPPLHPAHPTWCQDPEGSFSHRPWNVVGSYVVYHATRASMHPSREQAEKYRSCKAMLIPRPQLVDADGNGVWGDLDIDTDEGKLTVTIPQAFLDSAKYPVRHAAGATFGFEGWGNSNSANMNDQLFGTAFVCPAAGAAASMSVRVSSFDGQMKMALYKDDDNVLKGYTEEWSGMYAGGTMTLNFISGGALLAIAYKLACWLTESNCQFWYDSTGGAGFRDIEAYDGFPDPLEPTGDTKKFSIWCTYDPTIVPGSGLPAAARLLV